MCARAGNRAVCLRCALHTGSESQRSGGPARFARPVSWVCCCPTAVASKPPKILSVYFRCVLPFPAVESSRYIDANIRTRRYGLVGVAGACEMPQQHHEPYNDPKRGHGPWVL